MPTLQLSDALTPAGIFKEELEVCVKGTSQSKNFQSIIHDLVRDKEQFMINGKPLVDLLVQPPEPLFTDDENGKKQLIKKMGIIMNQELGMKLPSYIEGEENPALLDALRIFTQRGFSHLATNLLVKSTMNSLAEVAQDSVVQMDIRSISDTRSGQLETSGLRLSTTASIYQTRSSTPPFAYTNHPTRVPLITCKSELSLPVNTGTLQRNSSNDLMYNSLRISSSVTHPTFHEVCGALNQVDDASSDFDYVYSETSSASTESPTPSTNELKRDLLIAYATLQHPTTFYAKIKAQLNAPKMAALDKAIECLNNPTPQKIHELKDIAQKMKGSKSLSPLLTRAIDESQKTMLHLQSPPSV